MTATMTQIAKQAGVSVSLVSRLLRGDKSLSVSDHTRKRVLEVCDQMGGVRSWAGASRGGRSDQRHVIVPINRTLAGRINQLVVSNPFIRHFEAAIKRQGDYLSFTFFDEPARLEALTELVEAGGRCDGLLLLHGVADECVAALLTEHRFPHVCVDPKAERLEFNTMHTHASPGIEQALEHLQSLGHERVVYAGPTSSDRYPAYVAALIRQGLPFAPELICDAPAVVPDDGERNWRGATAQAFDAWLQKHDIPSAVYCNNDEAAFGVMDVLHERGLDVGRDVSVVGYDDLERHAPTQAAHEGLTSVDSRPDVLAQRCAQSLMDQADRRQNQVVHEWIAPRLTVRHSTGPPRTNLRGDPDLRQASGPA